MKEYITTSKDDLVAIHKTMKEKDAYITKLEKALESIKRQLENAKMNK